MRKIITFIILFFCSIAIVHSIESQTASSYLYYDDFDAAINTTLWNSAATMTWGANFGIGANWSAGGVNSTDTATNGQLVNNNGSLSNYTYCVRMYDKLNKTLVDTWEGIMISDSIATWAMFIGQKTQTDPSYYVTWDGGAYTNTSILRTLGWHEFCIWSGNVTAPTRPYAYIDGLLVDIGGYPTGAAAPVTQIQLGRYAARTTTQNRYDVFRVWQGNYSNMPTINASAPFTIVAQNAVDGVNIANFSALVNGTLYNTTTGTVTTGYTLGNATVNITVLSAYFQNRTYNGVSMTNPLTAILTPEFSFNFSGYSNYTIYDNKNYTRTIAYSIKYVCMPNYNNSLQLKVDDIVRQTDLGINCNTSILYYNGTYTALNESNHSLGFFIFSNYTGPTVNKNFGNNSFLWDLYNPNATGSINRTSAFNFSTTQINLTCVDGVFKSLNYTLQFNNNTLYNKNNTNGTTQTNTTPITSGINTYTGTCADPWGNTSIQLTDYAYSNSIYLINEKDNTLFDINNISLARVYIDDNSTIYDFKTANASAVNVTIWGTAHLRFEFGVYDGAFPEVIRYIDTGLINGSIRVCVNRDDAVHYELLLYATTQKEAILKSVFSNCYVGADYTRFAYQNSLVLKTYTINTLYYLYTFDTAGNQIYLSAVDGSLAQQIDLDTLEFNLQSYNIGATGDAITTYKNETIPTDIKIEYYNIDDNNANISVTIKRLDTDAIVFSSTAFTDPNEFIIYFSWLTLAGISNNTMFQIIVDKTLTNGKTGQLKAYFDANARSGSLHSGVALTIGILLILFGLTLLSTKTTFSWFGILIMIAGIAILSMSPITWYIKFMIGIFSIGAMYLMAIMLGENKAMVT